MQLPTLVYNNKFIKNNKLWHDNNHAIILNTGRVINIGSLAGERNYPEPGLSVYCGTKQAVEGLSEALRFELARHGVNVAVVQPDAALLQKYLLGKQHR